jgi:hypothetical protein
MTVFLLSVAVTYVVWRIWLAHAGLEAVKLCSLALLSVVLLLFASWMAIPNGVEWSLGANMRSLGSSPEVAQVAVGILFGTLCGGFPWFEHVDDAESAMPRDKPGAMQKLAFLGTLAGLLLLALLAPSAPDIANRITRAETVFLKIQLATASVDKQLIVDIDRDIPGNEAIDFLPLNR